MIKARSYSADVRLHEQVNFPEPAGAASLRRLNVHRGNTRSEQLRTRARGKTDGQHRQALLVQGVELPPGARIGAAVGRQAEEDGPARRDGSRRQDESRTSVADQKRP